MARLSAEKKLQREYDKIVKETIGHLGHKTVPGDGHTVCLLGKDVKALIEKAYFAGQESGMRVSSAVLRAF